MNKDLYFEKTFAANQFNRERKYWLNKMSGEPEKSIFPTDFKTFSPDDSAIKKPAAVSFTFPHQLYERLIKVSGGSDSRLHMILATGLIVLLYKYTGNSDIIIATPIDKQEVEGKFINTVLPLRNHIAAQTTFKESLMQVRQTIIEASEHQNYPIETLPYDLNIPFSDEDDFPLFDIALLLENIQSKDYLGDLNINIVFSFLRGDEILEGVVDYNSSCYEASTIERINEHYIRLLQVSLADPGLMAADISLLSETEKKQLLIDFNDTAGHFPGDETIHRLFELQAGKTPGNIAAGEAEGMRMISYGKLNEKAGQLAGLLIEKGVRPGDIIPIMGQRKIEIIAGILGILKAGGAYLPIDATSPSERIKFLIRDSRAFILFTQTHLVNSNKEIFAILSSENVIALDEEAAVKSAGGSRPSLAPSMDPAYVIYTSGTTGRPKGVMISHRAAVNYLWWAARKYVKKEAANFALYTSFSFDMTVTSIFTPLLTGNAVVLYGGDYSQFLVEKIIEEKKVDILKLTPSHLKLIRNREIQRTGKNRVKRFILGGEELDTQLAKDIYSKFAGDIEIYNEYGPTEATVGCMFYRFNPGQDTWASVPIGVPAANTKIYLLDRNREPVPRGIAGEIYIGGEGIATGYLNRPELTMEKFNMSYMSHMSYKTGDLGRWLVNGNIEFLGRIDHQVKIRGFRIEPGETENQLLTHAGVKEAVVLARENQKGDKYLCAYIAAGDSRTGGAEALREYLSAVLPDYMIPSFFVFLDRLPLTANGKLNRKALPEPKIELAEESVPPRNEIERKLAKIWSEILGIDKEAIGIDANFFNLGGHSLNATVLAAKVHKAFDVKISLVDLFEKFTIRKLSGTINEAAKDKFVPLEPVEKKDYYDLSSAQKRLYILQQMEPGNAAYNLPSILPLAETIEIETLEKTFLQLISRHESLRTSFEMVGDRPVQRIYDAVDFTVTRCDADRLPEKIFKQFVKPFDLAKAPLLRASFITVGKGMGYVLLIDMHHIITDAVSQDILKKEFMALYGGEEPEPLKLQYKDFSEWQNSERQRNFVREQEQYWVNQFAGELPVINLPTDFNRPLMQSFEGDKLDIVFHEEDTARLKKTAKENDSTLYMTLLSVFNILLSKLSGQEDIIIGTPIAGRRHSDLDHIMGMFVNTLAMRSAPRADKTFKEFLLEVKQQTLAAYENQDFQFEDLVDRASVRRDTGRNPIFDIMFNFLSQEGYQGDMVVPGSIDESDDEYKYEDNTTKFDIILNALEYGEQIFCVLGFCTKLFKKETIERFVSYFKRIVRDITDDPGKKISGIEMMDKGEKERILYEFNEGVEAYPRDKTLHRLFEEQAEKTPDCTAAVSRESGGASTYLTYSQLNKKADQLACLLTGKGVLADNIVGIKIERSLEMTIGILAILKAGGAYLPIDPDYPEERVNYMLGDSNAKVLLTLPETQFTAELSSPASTLTSTSTSLAYVIYTSGSTGLPKGVLVEHRSAVNVLFQLQKLYPLGASDVYLLKTSYTFDVSVTELFGWFLQGGRLAILEKEGEKDPQKIMAAIAYAGVTHINFVPSMFNAFVESLDARNITKLSGLRYIFLAGEALLPGIVEKFKRLNPDRTIALENIYGPTEGTVYSGKYSLCQWDGKGIIPIGKPIKNVILYILDHHCHKGLQPVGVPGELCIGGAGVARGYLNRPGLTAEKFIFYHEGHEEARRINMSSRSYLSYIYKTGDLARWLSDGNIEFLGRMDHQVKIRGFRIELEEIENRLLKHNEIKEAVALVRQDNSGDKHIIAYLVSNRELPASGLREYLADYLPDYMIPSHFVFIEKIPLNPGGKVNRKALPDPEIKPGDKYSPPRNDIEKKLAQIWSEVLDVQPERIGIDANFFELGGHSLRATIVISRIYKILHVNVPLFKLFANATIRRLADYIKGVESDKYAAVEPAETKEYYALSAAQKRLYLLQQREPRNMAYNLLETYVSEGELQRDRMEDAFKRLIKQHESLRTSFEMIEDTPVQRVHQEVEFSLEYHDLSVDKGETDENRELTDSIIKGFVRPFDLSRAPLLRVGMINIHPKKHILMVDIHHIISDGVSQTILAKDFAALYAGEKLPPLTLHYKDFSQWQNKLLASGEIKKQEEYWLKEFAGGITKAAIPTDYPRPSLQSFTGDGLEFEINEKDTGSLKELANKEEVTLFMVLLAVYNILLAKLGDREDIIVGTGTAGRKHTDIEKIIGIFVNTLALRNFPAHDKTFRQFLAEVKQRTLSAFENQDYRFEDLVEKVIPQRDISGNPLFDTVLMLHNFGDFAGNIPAPETNPLILKQYHYRKKTSQFDMTFNCADAGDTLLINVVYCSELFKKETIEMFANGFKQIISTVLENNDILLKDIGLSLDVQLTDTAVPQYDFEF